jgi:hypothetical protein
VEHPLAVAHLDRAQQPEFQAIQALNLPALQAPCQRSVRRRQGGESADAQAARRDGGEVMRPLTCSLRLRGRFTTVGPGLVDAELRAADGCSFGLVATVASQLAFATERTFQEHGTVAFDGEQALRLSTLGRGDLTDVRDDGLRHGTAVLLAEGIGPLAGARGRITSNFLVSMDGDVIDEQVIVLFVQEGAPT